MFGLEEQVQRHKLYSMEYTWMLNKSFECHEKVLFSCQRHFRKKGKTMIMFLSDKHFDIPFRGSLIWMEWMNCWSDQDGNIHSTRFDFATYTKAVETMALFVEKECACFILNTDVDLKIIRFSLLDIRLEICRDHNDQRSCKICASCVQYVLCMYLVTRLDVLPPIYWLRCLDQYFHHPKKT